MDLLPESLAALNEYLDLSQADLTEAFLELAGAAQGVVPEVVALSLCLVEEDLTFTMAEKDLADASPAVDEDLPGMSFEDDPHVLDENLWQLDARVFSARGIASSVTFPVIRNGQVVWGITVYASTPDAFVGHLQELAQALGAWDVGAVTNSDLGFRTRGDAQRAPEQMRARRRIEVALGMYAGRHRVSVEAARRELERLATASGLTLLEAAEQMIEGRHTM